MNFRMLANFIKIAEIGSLKGAAEAVRIAQPALTRQVALLEAEAGARLFTRHRRGVTLTEAGMRFRAHAERILGEYAHALDAVSAAGAVPSGTVSLGLPSSMLYVLSGAVVSAYAREYPQVYLKVHEAIGHKVEELLRARQVDVAILISAPRRIENVVFTPLVGEDVYLAGPAEAGLELDRPVAVADLVKLPMILFGEQNFIRRRIEHLLDEQGLALSGSLEVDGQPLLLDLVRRGVGYTVLPYCALEAEMAAGRISGAPVSGLQFDWTLGVNAMRAHAPASRALVGMIEDAVRERIKGGHWRVVSPDAA